MALLAGLALNAGADAFVSININGFFPSSVTIAPHQTVWFTVEDDNGPYTVSSPKGYWTPWYLFDQGDGFGIQINEPGVYQYYDAFSWNRGVIYVNYSAPPSLGIVNPTEGQTYAEPASFTFSVDASDPTGLSDVEFYLGNTFLDDVYVSPFQTHISGLAAGDYTLTAVAHNYLGGATTNSVHITVTGAVAPPITLSSPTFSGGQVHFEVSGFAVGRTLVLQYLADLATTNWISVATNQTSSSAASFDQPMLPGNRFFRIVQLP